MLNQRMIDFYMGLTNECSAMSRAIRSKCGAVIVKNDNILSFSWNGTPKNWDNTCEDVIFASKDIIITPKLIEEYPYEKFDETLKIFHRYKLVTKPEVLHAERNAIDKLAKSNYSSSGASLFTTLSPCIECAKSIYGAEIKEVYYKYDYRITDGLEFLEKVGINIYKV